MNSSARFACLSIALLALPLAVSAQTQTFSDVRPDSVYFSAAEYVNAMGIMKGYADGTFGPEKNVNRAETAKLLTSALATTEELARFTESSYTDIPAGVWYLQSVEFARELGIINGPPLATAFRPTDGVKKAEFLKMYLRINNIDASQQYGEIADAFATDETNATEWHFPLLRYAVATTITTVGPDGNLNPGQELTRGQIALMIYRHAMYLQGRRAQAGLAETEVGILNVLQFLDQQDIDQASYAATRALITARGALTSKPDEPIVKGAVKTAEGFKLLVAAYRAGTAQNYPEVIRLAGEAWQLAERAKEFSPGLATVAGQMQTIAKTMADDARTLQSQGTPQ